MTRLKRRASSLPAPRPGVDLVPDGWCERTVIPWADRQQAVGAIRRAAAQMDGLIAAYRVLDADTLELMKARRYLEVRWGELLGPGMAEKGGRGKLSPASDGLPRMTRRRFRQLAAGKAAVVARLREATDADELSRAALLRGLTRASDRDRARRTAAGAHEGVAVSEADRRGRRWTLLLGDFRERLAGLEPESVDLVVTDPPYGKEFLPLWSALGAQARRLLRPGGILVARTGHLFLPDILAALTSQGLQYGWLYAEPLPGSNVRFQGRKIAVAWQPWAAFSSGSWPSGRLEWHPDLLAESPRAKARYVWEQKWTVAAELIATFAGPDALVVDPMAGSGSFGEAALQVGCRWVGVETDRVGHAQAAERLAACENRTP